jgi:hypothetical protein
MSTPPATLYILSLFLAQIMDFHFRFFNILTTAIPEAPVLFDVYYIYLWHYCFAACECIILKTDGPNCTGSSLFIPFLPPKEDRSEPQQCYRICPG